MTRRAPAHLRQVARSFLGTHFAMISSQPRHRSSHTGGRQVQVSTPGHGLRASLASTALPPVLYSIAIGSLRRNPCNWARRGGQSELWAAAMGARRWRARKASVAN